MQHGHARGATASKTDINRDMARRCLSLVRTDMERLRVGLIETQPDRMAALIERLGTWSSGIGSALELVADRDAGNLATVVYVAGPMTGLPDFNYPAFEHARALLKAEGLSVLCPVDNDDGPEPGSRPWSWYMRRAIRQLITADGVAYLPGSESSKGAQVEIQLAHTLEMDVRPIAEWLGDPPGAA